MPTAEGVDRRAFLKGAVSAGAGMALFHSVPAGAQGKVGRPAPSNRIQMGAIGLGGMGRGNLGGFLGMPDVQVVAVCDVDRNHLGSAKAAVDGRYGNQDCAAYVDFRELLARGDIDALSVGTPDHWHALIAVAGARAGCDIYSEKPLSHCLAEGRAMADAVKEHGRIWQTGSWQRSVGNFHRACELVRNGRVGKIVRVEVGLPASGESGPVRFSNPPPELDWELWLGPSRWTPYCESRVHFNWRWQLDYGGGGLMDWVGHHGDIAHWGMGWDETGPLTVEGKATWPRDGIYDAELSYAFDCEYAGGVVMHVGGDVRGGTRWIANNGNWLWVDRGVLEAQPASILEERIGPDDTHLYRSDNHHRNFIDCVRSRQPAVTPCETAHRSASIGHLGHIAMTVGRKIRWNPVTEEIAGDPSASRMLSLPMRAPWHL
ncbi:MAG: Gfo/Idh/MocA family oxidoreductase [Armatimonadetes bacterium]|nr:Gfo/Idh/MocA family oxidoreductase [Armatimonadota bacterium]